MTATDLAVGGFIPFTTIDYPGQLSAVIFCQGCTWRCTYCHNTHLQRFASGPGLIPWNEIHAMLTARTGFLDAVVFSGGEPTAQAALMPAIQAIKAMGFQIGLHTAGMHPEMFRQVLSEVDWVGFDVKAPFDHRYTTLTGTKDAAARVKESLGHLITSGVPYELRTTMDPVHINPEARTQIESELKALGTTPTRWQQYRSSE